MNKQGPNLLRDALLATLAFFVSTIMLAIGIFAIGYLVIGYFY